MLQAIDIRKKYGDNEILKGVTVRVDKGEVVAVIGRSGSGKSTLLRCLNHLETIDSGEIRIDGQAMVTTGADGAARYRTEKDLRGLCLKMGLVFQDYNLFPHYTVLRNIVAPQQLVLHRSRQEAEQKAMLLLEKVGLADKAGAYPCNLSGGQCQRVAIARALATNPRVLLCDEATSALDPATTESILALIKDINRRLGITAVIITHEMSVIEKICNQVAIISHGRIAESGSVEEVFFHPRTEEARQLVIPEAMQPEQMPHERLYRIIFNGRSSFEPVIGNLVLECGAPVNIMYADTRDIGGTAFGQMVLQLPDDEAVVRRILAFAESKGLMLEEMNHV